jgi:excisionase family DNA binding protein
MPEASVNASGLGPFMLNPGQQQVGRRIAGISTPSPEEIQAAINPAIFPPILTVHQAATLLQVSIRTLYRAVSEGRYKAAVRRGRPLRFWRDRLIQAFFER